MGDIDWAITVLSEQIENSCLAPAMEEAIKIAVPALQEKAEREAGCELCHSRAIDRAELTNSFGELHIALVGGGKPDEESKLKFCPNCGRDLRKR